MNDYKVLVPLDGSRLAEHSLAYLAALKCLGETKVLLLGIVDEFREVQAVDPDAEEREENLLLTYLKEVASEVGDHLGIAVETKVLKGVPAVRIVEAEASAPDLLVISTHARPSSCQVIPRLFQTSLPLDLICPRVSTARDCHRGFPPAQVSISLIVLDCPGNFTDWACRQVECRTGLSERAERPI